MTPAERQAKYRKAHLEGAPKPARGTVPAAVESAYTAHEVATRANELVVQKVAEIQRLNEELGDANSTVDQLRDEFASLREHMRGMERQALERDDRIGLLEVQLSIAKRRRTK